MESFAFCRLLNGTTDTPAEEMTRIAAVTAEDVTAAAKTFVLDTVFFLNGTAEEGEEEEDDE